jgi:hypothetical protein
MKMKIYKYEIPIKDEFILELPKGAKILSFQKQHGKPYIWCLVNQEETEPIKFRMIIDGHDFDYDGRYMRFIGTIQMTEGYLVLHLFKERFS